MPIVCSAAVAPGNGSFILDEIVVADPMPDEVQVKIMAAGVCHTDHDSLNWGRPIVMGHEGAGVVQKVGDSVKDIQVGDSVLLNWATPCLECFQCMEGNQHICENNSPVLASGDGFTDGHAHRNGTKWRGGPIGRSFNIGTLSEYTLVKESACVKLHLNGMPFASASIIGCGVMTGVGSVLNAARLKPGSSAVVLGTGGVGLNVIQGARISGASKIIAVDINQNRLELAKRFGATHTLLADKNDTGLLKIAEKVRAMTHRGADYAFECTAIPALGAAPLAMVRNAGTAVQVSGIEEEIRFDMNLFEWDKIYINPLYGKCRPQIDFPKLVDLYHSGQLLLDEMITNTYRLTDLQTAFDDMLSGANAKGVVAFPS